MAGTDRPAAPDNDELKDLATHMAANEDMHKTRITKSPVEIAAPEVGNSGPYRVKGDLDTQERRFP